jgi:hypothetical protein
MNAQAQWYVLDDLFRKWGNDNFKKIVPKPPEMDMPRTPDEEFTRALQGQEIRVHPMDQDDQHLAEHQLQIQQTTDPDAKARLIQHTLEHQAQKQQKLMMAAKIGAQMELAAQAGIDPAQLMGGMEDGQQQPGQPAAGQQSIGGI